MLISQDLTCFVSITSEAALLKDKGGKSLLVQAAVGGLLSAAPQRARSAMVSLVWYKSLFVEPSENSLS